jgi:hypothetical protein
MYGIPFFVSLLAFCGIDSAITKLGLEGVYYAVHTIHNAGIVYLTAPEVYRTLTDFGSVATAPTNYFAAEIVFALHLYHCVYYWRKFRFDDWLHHILMIGVALPIGIAVPSGTLLGFSLFFTTGLPGGIDYFLLFLTRNFWINRLTEKRVNAWLATWIRAPGCVAQAALTLALLSTQNTASAPNYVWLAYLTAGLNYWNGMYFASQVLYDAGTRQVAGALLA